MSFFFALSFPLPSLIFSHCGPRCLKSSLSLVWLSVCRRRNEWIHSHFRLQLDPSLRSFRPMSAFPSRWMRNTRVRILRMIPMIHCVVLGIVACCVPTTKVLSVCCLKTPITIIFALPFVRDRPHGLSVSLNFPHYLWWVDSRTFLGDVARMITAFTTFLDSVMSNWLAP